MASPASGGCAQAPTSGWVGLRLVRSPALSRPHTQLGLQPRLEQPTIRRTTRRPQQDEQVGGHAPRSPDPIARSAAASDLQHPARRRWQRPPCGQCIRSHGRRHRRGRRDTAHALAMVVTEMAHAPTTFEHGCASEHGVVQGHSPRGWHGRTHPAHPADGGYVDGKCEREMRCGTTGYPLKISRVGGSTSRDVCQDSFFSASGSVTLATGFNVWYGTNCAALQRLSRLLSFETWLVATFFARVCGG